MNAWGFAVPRDGTAAGDPRAVLERVRRTAAGCAERSGPVLPYIGTVNASRDLDVMRQALGDRKPDYLGFSHGTRLGAVNAARFPGTAGRTALDGVDTLTESPAERGGAAAAGQDPGRPRHAVPLDRGDGRAARPVGRGARQPG